MNDLLITALSQYGIKEISGEKDNNSILTYFKECGHQWVKDDETAWCSAFVNWCAKITGYEYTKELNAKSWLEVGEEIKNPVMGDIVVFWRITKNSGYGHVAIYINKVNDEIYCLGGNQNNMVNISSYPKDRVIGFRRLSKIK